jgi:hypothetical protein
LIPTPDAPQLLHPRDDTAFWYESWDTFPHDIELEWGNIEGTQYYELIASRDSSLPEEPIKVYNYNYTLTIDTNSMYYWKVRAYSRNWEWYTRWSETWCFSAWGKE